MSLPFSIIIPTFHRHSLVEQSLSRLLTLQYPKQDYEIIVVSNDPEDRKTEHVVKRFQKHARNLKYCTERQRGASLARNRGIQEAAYVYLIFVDDDVKVSPLFLKGYQRAWNRFPDVRMMGGRLTAHHTNNAPLTHNQRQLVQRYDWCFGHLNRGEGDQILTEGELLYSGNISYRREQGQTIVFHPALGRYAAGVGRIGGEDFELCTRTILQGERIMYIADQDCAVENDVAIERYTEAYISKRHFISGIELALQEHCIKHQFPQFQSFYLESLRSFEGVKRLLFNKHERTMLLSYFFNGRMFATFHSAETLPQDFSRNSLL